MHRYIRSNLTIFADINFYSKSIRTAETTEIRDTISTLRLLNDAEFVLGVVAVVVIGPFGGGKSSI